MWVGEFEKSCSQAAEAVYVSLRICWVNLNTLLSSLYPCTLRLNPSLILIEVIVEITRLLDSYSKIYLTD